MNTAKPWYQSTTLQGLLVTIIVLTMQFFKINIPGLQESISTIVEALMALIGSIMIFIGRIKANTHIQ